jgi:hypothetical protein
LVYHQFSYWRRKCLVNHAQLTPSELTGSVRIQASGTGSPMGAIFQGSCRILLLSNVFTFRV